MSLPAGAKRIYLQVEADARHTGVYRSDDGGASFHRVDDEGRVSGRGADFRGDQGGPQGCRRGVCLQHLHLSFDGRGRNAWTAIKGALGGDDYHRIWIDPDHPQVLLLGNDQGAVISFQNGGRTWSSWYNQPTAQFYHVIITDDRFPPIGCTAASRRAVPPESPAAATTGRSRSASGIRSAPKNTATSRPSPLHPNLVYGGKLSRFDWSTGQVQDVAPETLRGGKIRYVRTQPLVFSPADPHVLYYAGNVLFKTRDGGQSWQTISPDLTRPHPEVPAVLGAFTAADPQAGAHRGVIYALAPAWSDVRQIWDRHRRRAHPAHPRRRCPLAGRHPAGAHLVEQGVGA